MTLTVPQSSAGSLHSVRFGLMTATAHADGPRTVVLLRGEADYATTHALADILSWVTAWRSGDIVVDLSDLNFIDTATVRVLAECRLLMGQSGRKMTFRSPSSLAARLLSVSDLTDCIETRESHPTRSIPTGSGLR
jgi:anti-anti-sigma factor